MALPVALPLPAATIQERRAAARRAVESRRPLRGGGGGKERDLPSLGAACLRLERWRVMVLVYWRQRCVQVLHIL